MYIDKDGFLTAEKVNIRDKNFLWIYRKVVRSATNLSQNIDEGFARFRQYQEKREYGSGIQKN